MIIVFSGLDGCGKTTQAMLLKEDIEKSGEKCRYFHIVRDSWYYFLLHSVIGRVSVGMKNSAESGLRGGGSWKKTVLGLIKKIFLFIELVRFNVKALSLRGNEKHVICDRYFYDEIVQARYLGIVGSFFETVYMKLIPRPDVIFFLAGDVAAFKERKKEHDDGYYAGKSGLYEALMKDANAYRVLSDRPVGQVHDEIKEILKNIRKETR